MSIFNLRNRKDNGKEQKNQVEEKEISKSTVPSQVGQNSIGASSENLSSYETNPRGVNPKGVNPRGVNPKGVNPKGVTPKGVTPNRVNLNKVNQNAVDPNRVNPIGTNPMESISMGAYESKIPYVSDYAILPKNPIPKYKRLVEKKLTVILIENTDETVNIKDILVKIIKSTVSYGLICVIKYGNCIRQSNIMDVASFNDSSLLSGDNEQNTVCLYDALKALEDLVNKEYMVTHEKEFERERVNQIEVIGIGTCKDNCSVVSREVGIESFCNVAKKPNITTKYFCITEESFVNAAEIGFHSIGAISRNY